MTDNNSNCWCLKCFFENGEKPTKNVAGGNKVGRFEIGRLLTVHRLARENKSLLKKTGLLVSQSENNIATS